MKRPRLEAGSEGRGVKHGLRAAVAAAIGLLFAHPGHAGDGTLSFAVYDWTNAMYESRFMDECPEGLNLGNDEFWWRGLAPTDRAKLTNNGLIESGNRYGVALKRGPHHEDVCLDPTLVDDPPFRTVEGAVAYGANLDGTDDGHATAKTCGHKKFSAPDGTPGIDNQMYRLIGCTYGWRKDGLIDSHANDLRRASGLGMILIEVTGVTDPRNSDNVTVTFYRSIDQFTLDGASKPLPFATYRTEVTDGKQRYADSVKGSIKDGVLTTDRGDVHLPNYGNYAFVNPLIRDLGLRLEIAPDGVWAKGTITGYYSVDQFVHYASGLGGIIPISYYSCPALYRAAHKLADGYPDPATGECTMLSSAFAIEAVSGFILHPDRPSRSAQR